MFQCLRRRSRSNYESLEDQSPDGVSEPIQLQPEVSHEPEPKGCLGIWRAWPKTTFCIVSNEFCERFSYYGMRAVLTLYLINILKVSDDGATALYHGFTVLAYSSPLLGSTLADGYIGKFRTILWISLLYAAGQVVLSVASTSATKSSLHPGLDFLGLFIIALGTGGIKPCVAAFGGDQFKIGQERMISLFFSMFYFSINAGSTISIFVTPIFRALPCMGRDSCYPLAFGIPAVLMVLATMVFASGSFWYKKYPPTENVIFEVLKAMKTAIGNKRRFNVSRPHWMDHYLDNHSCDNDVKCQELKKSSRKKNKCQKRHFVDDIKSLLRVIVMYVPVPMFWALYDQQGSRWTIQAVGMDARLWPGFSLLPDQMQTLNAILIMLFIPIFQLVIYPLVEKCGIKTTPLRRMSVGGLLAALAFVISALVQFKVNETLPDIPANDQAFVSFINSFPNCNLTVTSPDGVSRLIPSDSSLEDDKVKKIETIFKFNGVPKDNVDKTFKVGFTGDCSGLPGLTNGTAGIVDVTATLQGGKSYYVVLGFQGVVQEVSNLEKPTEGEGEFKANSLPPSVSWGNCKASEANSSGTTYDGPMALCERSDRKGEDDTHPCDPRHNGYFYAWQIYNDSDGKLQDDRKRIVKNHNGSQIATIYDYNDIKPGLYDLYYLKGTPKDPEQRTFAREDTVVVPTKASFEIKGQGGIYSISVTSSSSNPNSTTPVNVNTHIIVSENHISILWQIPQYVVITAGEILFSITGLEFSYSQVSFVSIGRTDMCKALFLGGTVYEVRRPGVVALNCAFGDQIILAIAAASLFSNRAIEMLAFAGAMVVVILVFIVLAYFYKYNYYTRDETEDDEDLDKSATASTVE